LLNFLCHFLWFKVRSIGDVTDAEECELATVLVDVLQNREGHPVPPIFCHLAPL